MADNERVVKLLEDILSTLNDIHVEQNFTASKVEKIEDRLSDLESNSRKTNSLLDNIERKIKRL